jgi:hypothetical protein
MYSHLHASNWKKYLGIIDTLWNCRNRLRFGRGSFRVKLCKCINRYWIVGFSIHGLFFIRYFKQKDEHYERDLIPVLDRWCNQTTNLEFHIPIRAQSFHNMFLNLIHNLSFLDSMSVARDHLSSYHYSDNRSFELLQKTMGIYNNMVGSFINGITADIEVFLKLELPTIRQYRHKEDPKSNFYHYSNILYYFWLVYWQSRDGRQETRLEMIQYGNSHHLRISTSAEPIASADNIEDIVKLQTFMTNKTPSVIFRLTRLNEYRIEATEQYEVFRQNIRLLLEKQAWTRPIRGRCKWEQQYFSIQDT